MDKKSQYYKDCVEAVQLVHKHGNITRASEASGIARRTLSDRYNRADALGIKMEKGKPRIRVQAGSSRPVIDLDKEIPKIIRKAPMGANELAERLNASRDDVLSCISNLKEHGVSIHQINGKFEITPPPMGNREARHRLVSGTNDRGQKNWFKFGVVADNHIGSKYARLDVVNDLYDRFEEEGVDTVFNLGNYIDGEARFNKHELVAHGLEGQCQYLASTYPYRKGITTYAVSGDDHEGWYAQREGVNIGRYVENVMRANGRTDWVDIGYMNSYVDLENAESGAVAVMELCHPGGGSSYADSYAVQKAVEAMEGGEKPAIWMGGHYHKMITVNYRGVWCFLCACTKDLDTFGRKKKLRYVIGGAIVEAQQDPDTGAITRFKPDMLHYFNRGYYQNRWSHHGDVTQPMKIGPNGSL